MKDGTRDGGARTRTPHAATLPRVVVQPKAVPERPPHPATVVQPKPAFTRARAYPPHPATVPNAARAAQRSAGVAQRSDIQKQHHWSCTCGEADVYEPQKPTYACWECGKTAWLVPIKTVSSEEHSSGCYQSVDPNLFKNFEKQAITLICNNVKDKSVEVEMLTATCKGTIDNPVECSQLRNWFSDYQNKNNCTSHVGGVAFIVDGLNYYAGFAVNDTSHTEKECAYTFLAKITTIPVDWLKHAFAGFSVSDIKTSDIIPEKIATSVKGALKQLIEDFLKAQRGEKREEHKQRTSKVLERLEALKAVKTITYRYVLGATPCGMLYSGSGDSFCGEFLQVFANVMLKFFCPKAKVTWDYILWK